MSKEWGKKGKITIIIISKMDKKKKQIISTLFINKLIYAYIEHLCFINVISPILKVLGCTLST